MRIGNGGVGGDQIRMAATAAFQAEPLRRSVEEEGS